MRDFPVEMQGDIAFELHKDVLALPLFDNASQGCIRAIAMQVRSKYYRLCISDYMLLKHCLG